MQAHNNGKSSDIILISMECGIMYDLNILVYAF